MKVYAPNKQYSGISAGIPFVNGEADVPKERVDWFRTHGYTVEEKKEPDTKAKK